MKRVKASALFVVACLLLSNSSTALPQPAPVLQLRFTDSKSYQSLGNVPLKRAVIAARLNKDNILGTSVAAFILLTNVASDTCDLGRVPLGTDYDFALVSVIRERYREQDGPESASIYRTLFRQPEGTSASRHLYMVTLKQPEHLQEVLGDVHYRATQALIPGSANNFFSNRDSERS